MTTKEGAAENLVFPDFNDIKVSTKTFIVKTNVSINLEKLYHYLPVTDYIMIPKKRGRKKKVEYVNPNKDIADGSIITMKFENNIKGVDLKEKKTQKKKRAKWFRNSFTVVIILDSKPVNFKICQNGMFQITGCKFDEHAEKCITYIWDYIKDEKDIWTYHDETKQELEVLFVPAMRNVDFSLGFLIDREALSRYMSIQTQFYSLLETSFGYTGVNIKVPLEYNITDMEIKRITYDKENQSWKETMTTYTEYLEKLSEKERNKKLNKDRYNTFLVFHSGRVIISGLTAQYMKNAYYYFLDIIRACKDEIEEKLDV